MFGLLPSRPGRGALARAATVVGAVVLLGTSFSAGQAEAQTAASAVAKAPATGPTAPSWLMPVGFEHYVTTPTTSDIVLDSYCSGILISPARLLMPAGCPTGHSAQEYEATDFPQDAFQAPTYQTQGTLAVTPVQVSAAVAKSPAPLAGAADSKLYAAGTQADFWSWENYGDADNVSQATSMEPVVVESAATCEAQLNAPLAAGSLCTEPAPGAKAPVCAGDSGGALVAGGKLIGISETPVRGCTTAGVRVYTSIAANHALIEGWGRALPVNLISQSTMVAANWGVLSECFEGLSSCLEGGSGQFGDATGEFNLTLDAGDLNGSGHGDLMARDTSGRLWVFPDLWEPRAQVNLMFAPKYLLGSGFNQYRTIVAPGDLTGDGLPDLLAVDNSGVMWLFPGNGKGGYGVRVRISAGWNVYNTITASGDLSGDGIPDVVVRDHSGDLWLYTGNGHGGFNTHRTYLGAGWGGFTAVDATGDIDNQGPNEVVGRMSNGWFYVYAANGTGGLAKGRLEDGNSVLTKARLS